MTKKKFRQWVALSLISSVILTLTLTNRLGGHVLFYETKIYGWVKGKKPQHIQYDSAGVPIVYYEGSLGIQYNVVTVAEESLRLSTIDDSVSEKQFFTCVKWLIQNCKSLNDSSIIFYNYYNWSHYGMIAPWRSAMNQGRAMQSFLKAFEKTGDSLYLEYAKRSMNTLFIPVDSGGVSYLADEGYWFEEYADDNVPQSRVLNGMIVVLQALSDFHKVTNDPNSFFLFTNGVKALKSTLHLYDNDGHSNYDVLGKPAKQWYHKFHIEQLEFLYNETLDPIFNEYKQKWMLYKEPSYLANLIQKPTRIGVFAVLTLFAGVLVILSMISWFVWFRKSKVEKV